MRLMIWRRRALLITLLLGLTCTAQAAEPPALVRARARYNAADFDGAIQAAAEVRAVPQWADAAGLVMARAHIERHRTGANASDLSSAREILAGVRAAALAPRDRVDLLVGMAQILFADESFGAAAELFETALRQASVLGSADRDLLLEWWATALDRDARSRPVDRRLGVFARVLERMEQELGFNAASPVANYWVVAALRGGGDLERAWAAACAGWIRASLATPRTDQLRTDLDTLVTEALIPERVKARPVREQQSAGTALRAEWELFKQNWR